MSQSPQYFECFLCSRSTEQKRCLMNLLVRRLAKQINLLKDQSGQIANQQERQGFNQILRILFIGQTSREGSQCRHDKFQKYLLKKLKCSKETLNFLCERLAYFLAEKNYHLELVCQQIKHVTESISQGKLQFNFSDMILSSAYKQEQEKSLMEPEKRVTRASKKTLLKNAKNQEQPQRKNQNEELIQLPSMNSLTFAPVAQSQANLNSEQQQINMAGYNFYYSTFPYFFARNQ